MLTEARGQGLAGGRRRAGGGHRGEGPGRRRRRAGGAGIGFPVVLKILSPDISHKSDVGGVVLQPGHADDVRARRRPCWRAWRLRPDARDQGFTVQAMVQRPQALELIVGSHVDPVFGPVILFGEGGTRWRWWPTARWRCRR
jgi:acyl-CoA synthetase (NDP forming)